MGFALSLVGRFGAGLSQWLTRWFSARPSVEVLQDYVDDALGTDKTAFGWAVAVTSTTDIATSCEQIAQLFKRVLVFWLCLLALASVL